jgi:osmotically-inducible protein OsmY
MSSCLDSSGVERNAEDRLRSRLHVEVNRMSCQFRDGVLYLRGRSNTYYQKQLAQEAVRCLDGVSKIVNQIRVNKEPNLA